jgi:hypothetical protein
VKILDPTAVSFWEPSDIARYNNEHTHSEVLAAFDLAIAHERAKRTLSSITAEMKGVYKVQEPV